MDKRFKKGQSVFYASKRFASGDDINGDNVYFCCVIERTVDSCGKKKMTFEDHGLDNIFGRSTWAPFSNYFETREQAEQHLDNLIKMDPSFIRVKGTFSDRSAQCFDELQNYDEYLREKSRRASRNR